MTDDDKLIADFFGQSPLQPSTKRRIEILPEEQKERLVEVIREAMEIEEQMQELYMEIIQLAGRRP